MARQEFVNLPDFVKRGIIRRRAKNQRGFCKGRTAWMEDEEIAQRVYRVHDLYVRQHISLVRIAQIEQVHVNTVIRDIRRARELLTEQATEDLQNSVNDAISSHRGSIEELRAEQKELQDHFEPGPDRARAVAELDKQINQHMIAMEEIQQIRTVAKSGSPINPLLPRGAVPAITDDDIDEDESALPVVLIGEPVSVN